MQTDQYMFWPDGNPADVKDQMTLQGAVGAMSEFDTQTHGIADAIAATIINAQAGLNWLQAQPPNVEEVRKVLDDIINNGKRANRMTVELRTLMNDKPAAD